MINNTINNNSLHSILFGGLPSIYSDTMIGTYLYNNTLCSPISLSGGAITINGSNNINNSNGAGFIFASGFSSGSC